MSSPTQDRFLAFAVDFEKTFADDDWTRLEPHLAEDAVYEVDAGPYSCRLEGRDAILRGMRRSLDGFDRRFDTRAVQPLGAPETVTRDGREEMSLPWRARYELGDAPPLVLEGRSTVRCEGDAIAWLRDAYTDAQVEQLTAWVERHAPDVDLRYTD